MEQKFQDLVVKLFDIQAYKFGNFTLKSGGQSPVYFDLRVIVSYPEVMVRFFFVVVVAVKCSYNQNPFFHLQDQLADLILEFMEKHEIRYDHVCGVPYTALPIATLVAVKAKKGMLIRRKETKDYGTKKLIEGNFKSGDNCLIIEDVITSGSSVLETVRDLKGEGLAVTHAIVVVDREQGGATAIGRQGVKTHSLFALSELLDILVEKSKIDVSMKKTVEKYLEENQVATNGAVTQVSRTSLTFEARSESAKNQVAKRLFNLMSDKRTNLCLAADVTKAADILKLAQVVGPFIAVLKLHVDIIEDFSTEFIASLVSIAKTHNFLLMEDRKFADIGNTVALQYTSGQFKISTWADLVTAHTLPGASLLKGLKSRLDDPKSRGVFLLAELSSAGNLINADYTKSSVKMALDGSDVDFVAGIVCQNGGIFNQPGLIQLTPGVKLEEGGDDLGQQYNSPMFVVKEKGADLAVVGRGIYEAKNQAAAAETYRNALWAAYCERVGIKNEN